jgi:chromosome segregation ATPase
MALGTAKDQRILAMLNANMRRRLRVLKQKLRHQSAELHELERQNSEEDSLRRIEGEARDLEQRIEAEQKDLERLRREFEELPKKIVQVKESIKAERMVRNAVQDVLFKRREQVESEEAALQRSMTSAAERRARLSELQTKIPELHKEVTVLRADIEEQSQLISEARERVEEILAMDETLDYDISQREKFLDAARRTIVSQEGELIQLKRKLLAPFSTEDAQTTLKQISNALELANSKLP